MGEWKLLSRSGLQGANCCKGSQAASHIKKTFTKDTEISHFSSSVTRIGLLLKKPIGITPCYCLD